MARFRKGLHRFAATLGIILMLSTCFGFCIFAAAKSDEQNGIPESYSRDGWSVVYNPAIFWVFEGREEGDAVRFNYSGDGNTTANFGIDLTDHATLEEAMKDFDTYSFECVAKTTFHGDPAICASTGSRTTHYNGQAITGNTTVIAVNHNDRIYVMDIYITDTGSDDGFRAANEAIMSLMDSVAFEDSVTTG